MPARTILSPTSGFIREAGFTHSLTPARNCTFGCSYCYVPTMRLRGGLQPEDWRRWGQFTTFKENAPELLARQLRPEQTIYCSPLVDPYQPAEAAQRLMPRLLAVLAARPPRRFVLQTRGTLIRRDIELLRQVPGLRVSFSLTTNREAVRHLFEPHCATFEQRLETMRALRDAGIDAWATLAPLLPCDPEVLAQAALDATGRDLVGDPLHVQAIKPRGATTRDAALRIIDHHGFQPCVDPTAQAALVQRIAQVAAAQGRQFLTGPAGFALLSQPD